MKGSNKFAAVMLTAAMSVTSTGFSAFAANGIPADVAGTRFEEPIQILQALDIMVGDGNGKFRPDATIKRSEVAKIAVLSPNLI